MIKVYTDAAVNGNPGEVGLGILLVKDGEQFPYKFPIEKDNHQSLRKSPLALLRLEAMGDLLLSLPLGLSSTDSLELLVLVTSHGPDVY